MPLFTELKIFFLLFFFNFFIFIFIYLFFFNEDLESDAYVLID